MRRTSPPRASVCVASPNTARPKTRSPGATCVTPRSDLPNDTSHFVAENARIRRITGIKRERLEHVAKIHPRRFHVDQHLAGAALRQLERSETERIEMPALAGFEAQRQGGIKPLLAGRPAAIQSLGITRFAAEGNLALRGFEDQLAPKQRHVRW